MHFGQCPHQLGLHIRKTGMQQLFAGNDDVIMIAPGWQARRDAQSLAQPPPHPVALDSAAFFLGDSQAKSRLGGIRAVQGLQAQQAEVQAGTLGNGHELCPAAQAGGCQWTPHSHKPRHLARPDGSRVISGGEALASARPAGGNDLAAADGFHAGAKAVAALAHDFAGLKGPFHGTAPVVKMLLRAGKPAISELTTN